MKFAAIIFTMSVSVTAMFMAADACKNIQSMTWSEACLNVSTTPSLFNLCGVILEHVPDNTAAEVTVYAAIAAVSATQSYGATTDEAKKELLFGSLRAPERAAVEQCMYKMSMASGRMEAVARNIGNCYFDTTIDDYSYALAAGESCRDALAAFPASPMVALNAADRDTTTVALDLGSLMF